MGFWYNNADLGPRHACDPTQSTGPYPTFDTGDGKMNQSAYSTGNPFDLTGTPYRCISASGRGWLVWTGTQLIVRGIIFFDGSICMGSGGCGTNLSGYYTGQGTIIATGTFQMNNNDTMCVTANGLSGGSCVRNVDWDPGQNSIGIIAYGDDGNGNSITIKKGSFQGLLMGYNNVDCSVSGTFVQGPVVSVNGSVSCGQSGDMYFPAIPYPSNGFSGFIGPLPVPNLLPPQQYGGG
jgi:hypothetical protein